MIPSPFSRGPPAPVWASVAEDRRSAALPTVERHRHRHTDGSRRSPHCDGRPPTAPGPARRSVDRSPTSPAPPARCRPARWYGPPRLPGAIARPATSAGAMCPSDGGLSPSGAGEGVERVRREEGGGSVSPLPGRRAAERKRAGVGEGWGGVDQRPLRVAGGAVGNAVEPRKANPPRYLNELKAIEHFALLAIVLSFRKMAHDGNTGRCRTNGLSFVECNKYLKV